ncbi:MAG: polyphosphate polymerase domain-containing protein, partial [Lachnospiraceae bacterium]
EVFNRYEKKYILSKEIYEKLREKTEPYMQEDEYGMHTIRNLYFDNWSDELIRTSIEKPVYKEKFRIRCYEKPSKDTRIFLEIKKKYRGIVNKRRVEMTVKQAEQYLKSGLYLGEKPQILKEIDYFLQFYKVEPKLYLAYDRVALYGKEDKDFRITFDQNIRSRWEHLDLVDDTGVEYLLEEGTSLMEVKTKDALPLWFTEILSELQIRNTSFSKYGKIYEKRQRQKQEEQRKEGAA